MCLGASKTQRLSCYSRLHTFFFEKRGRQHRNHHLLPGPRGGTAVTACCIENIRFYIEFFHIIIFEKSVQLVGCVSPRASASIEGQQSSTKGEASKKHALA